MASRVLARIARIGGGRLISAHSIPEPIGSGLHFVRGFAIQSFSSNSAFIPSQSNKLSSSPNFVNGVNYQSFGFSSSTSSQSNDKERRQSANQDNEQKEADVNESNKSTPQEQEATTDEETELSRGDLIKLVAEMEEQLKLKNKEIEEMHDRVLRSYAEIENFRERAKREAENNKKFAIQNFAKALLDVADNLERASTVVKESFSKVDVSKDSAGVVPLLKTLLEGVEMTNKQLAEVFKKFGLEKYDPLNEEFDPNKHLAVFQVPDPSKPPGVVASVLKSGYVLYDRVIRPAEVGVTKSSDDETGEISKE